MNEPVSRRRQDLIIDIETVPCQKDDLRQFLIENVKPRANLKDPAKIEADLEEKRSEIVAQTALNGLWGEVMCVGWCVDDSDIQTAIRPPDEPEGAFLARVGRAITKGLDYNPRWVGFGLDFDTRFLFQRSVLNRVHFVPIIPVNEPAWSDKILDIQFQWGGRNIKGVSLNNLARAFGLEPKTMDPTEIEFYWHQGELATIQQYCAHDVELTRDLMRAFGETGWD